MYGLRKDADNQKYSSQTMRDSNIEMLREKEALEKHASIIQL